jgi:hypothetical protein
MAGKRRQTVIVNDCMQRGYRYERIAPLGRNFHPGFRPELTPKEMLELGVFCGKYMTDTRKEFPAPWESFLSSLSAISRHGTTSAHVLLSPLANSTTETRLNKLTLSATD